MAKTKPHKIHCPRCEKLCSGEHGIKDHMKAKHDHHLYSKYLNRRRHKQETRENRYLLRSSCVQGVQEPAKDENKKAVNSHTKAKREHTYHQQNHENSSSR